LLLRPRDHTGVGPGKWAHARQPATGIGDGPRCLFGLRRVADEPENAAAAARARLGRVRQTEPLEVTALLANRVGEKAERRHHARTLGGKSPVTRVITYPRRVS